MTHHLDVAEALLIARRERSSRRCALALAALCDAGLLDGQHGLGPTAKEREAKEAVAEARELWLVNAAPTA